jgi:hypothetical protein
MAEANAHAAPVADMLKYVPAAVPGAVSLERDSGLLRPGYNLRYLKTRQALATDEDAPGVETVELPIAAAWSRRFVVGIVLILLGVALAILLPAATHEGVLALIALTFVVLGLGGLWQSRFTPVEPNRLSLAKAVMRARLKALRTDDPREIAKEREIGDLLLQLAEPSRNVGSISSPGMGSSGTDILDVIVVVAGLAVVVGVFFGALANFKSSTDVTAVVGAVTGVVGTIVTAFFGIRATARAGSDAAQKVATAADKATQTVKDAHDKALAAAAYIPSEKAAEFVDKLGISGP